MSVCPSTSRRARRAPRGLVVLVVLLSITAAGCGTSGSDAGTTQTSSSPTATQSAGAIDAMKADLAKYSKPVTDYPTVAALGGVSALKGKTVWFIPIGGSISILNAYAAGMEDALGKVDVNFHICDGKFQPTYIASCMSQAVTQGADAVITGYIDYALVPTAFDALTAHHIPVLVGGQAPSAGKTSSAQLAFYPVTHGAEIMGRLSSESVIVDSSGKANVLFIGATDSALTQTQAAYTKQFFADKCPDCSFTDIGYNTAGLSRLSSQVSAALISNPNTDYVYVEQDAAVPSVLAAIQTSGFASKVKVVSTNGDLASLQRIQAGGLQIADAGVSNVYVGWLFVDAILRMMLGKVPHVQDGIFRIFNAQNVGDLTLTPDAYNTNAWYGTDQYKTDFEKAWGVN